MMDLAKSELAENSDEAEKHFDTSILQHSPPNEPHVEIVVHDSPVTKKKKKTMHCEQCEFATDRRDVLVRHMKLVHDIEVNDFS